MASQALREQAQALRRQGKSIADIVHTLQASKSTVSYWCRDISLSHAQRHALAEKQRASGGIGRLRAAELKRARRMSDMNAEMERGARDVGTLSQRDLFMTGLALYWGEGYKSGNEECGLTNSDPAIITTFIEWLRRIYAIPSTDLILRVSVNETHRHRVQIIEKYWSQMTGVPLSQFTSTNLIKARSKKAYADAESHFGTLRVKVRRGTALRRRIMGSISALKKR